MTFTKQHSIPFVPLIVGLAGGALFLIALYYTDSAIKNQLDNIVSRDGIVTRQDIANFARDSRMMLVIAGAGVVLMLGAIYWLAVQIRSRY